VYTVILSVIKSPCIKILCCRVRYHGYTVVVLVIIQDIVKFTNETGDDRTYFDKKASWNIVKRPIPKYLEIAFLFHGRSIHDFPSKQEWYAYQF